MNTFLEFKKKGYEVLFLLKERTKDVIFYLRKDLVFLKKKKKDLWFDISGNSKDNMI